MLFIPDVNNESSFALFPFEAIVFDDVVTQLDKNERVRIVETRVEDGCVRGRVVEVFSARRQHRHVNSKDTQMAKTIGWISLFEPPSLRWAEHITEEKEVP